MVDDNETIDLDSAVFKIFRKTNIIEFKSPDDELSKQVLWKAVGYASLYIAKYGVDDSDITITLLRDTKPMKPLKELADFVEADDENGIYYIKDWKIGFPNPDRGDIQSERKRECRVPGFPGFVLETR